MRLFHKPMWRVFLNV